MDIPAAAAPVVVEPSDRALSEMAFVKGGSYILGEDHESWANLPEFQRTNDQHPETVQDFYIGRYLITFRDYDAYCEEAKLLDKPNDQGWGRGNMPLINVTWLEVIKYCNWRSKKEGLREAFTEDGKLIAYLEKDKKVLIELNKKIEPQLLARVEGYRLPTDAEWEYAAKGGEAPRKYKFVGGDRVDEVAWYKDNTRYSTRSVGLKKPNQLGLYDMAGNVYEYIADGKLPHMRFLRGGGWSSQMQSMRACFRNGCRIDEAHSYVGFRLARSKPPAK